MGSETQAWRVRDSSGRRKPAISASTLAWPAGARATRSAIIVPRSVSTPFTAPFSMRKPTTAQRSTMSTPRASAARA